MVFWSAVTPSPWTPPLQKNLRPNDLIFEGVARDTHRKHLDDFGADEKLVPLDGVGGAVLLVRAEAHRRGLIFPTFGSHTEGGGWQRSA